MVEISEADTPGDREAFQRLFDAEKEKIETLSEQNPGAVYIGTNTGQLAVSFENEREDNITDIRIIRSRAQPEEGSPAQFHVLVAGVVRDEVAADEPFHTDEPFGSAMVALAHAEETIQYFDMLDVHIVTGDELVS